MRSLMICVIALSAPIAASAELAVPSDPTTGEFGYTKVVELPDVTADELHRRLLAWVAESYGSAAAVISLNTPESVVIAGEQEVTVTGFAAQDLRVRHRLTVDLKDGRYRVRLGGFRVDNLTSPVVAGIDVPLEAHRTRYTASMRAKVFAAVDAEATALLDSLQAGMAASREEW